MSETPETRLSPRELWQQQNDDANAKLQQLVSEVTQREWLIITTALDRTRQQIGADTGLTLLAGAWVQEKRAHGGASWDRLLDMTDDQLATLLGFPEGDGADLPTTVQPAPAPNADQIASDAIEQANAATTAAADRAQNGAHTSTSAQAS